MKKLIDKNFKIILGLCVILQSCASVKNVPKNSENVESLSNSGSLVQVVSPALENITGTEEIWLGGQIQDKLKSNLQEYLGMRIVVDSKSEVALKKLQQESEDEGRNEETAIELGKISTAKFALFSKIRKTNNGYIISTDFTDLATGEQKASVTSKEYTKTEYLYGNTGAIDEITLALADKLGIKISDVYRKALKNGTADFTVESQLALVEQNEANYKRLLNQFDENLRQLSTSTDINADNEKRKIEAEKALLVEKKNAEAKRKLELDEQKRKSIADEKMEKERSIEFITKRDELVKIAEEKASTIRKLKKEQQGILEQINEIENKKKIFLEIRQTVNERCEVLYKQYQKDKKNEIEKIKDSPYTVIELENGKPTIAAKKRRENQISASNDKLYNRFLIDAAAIKNATSVQENALLSEIRTEQKELEKKRTVNSLNGELKVSYGSYNAANKGWNASISVYSDGIVLYNDNFLINYELVTRKNAPNIATELNNSVVAEYSNNVEMYNSLFAHGTPLFYFELDYNVIAENDDKPSKYVFDFEQIRIISIVDGMVLQTTNLSKKVYRIMKPIHDIRSTGEIEQLYPRTDKKNFEKNEIYYGLKEKNKSAVNNISLFSKLKTVQDKRDTLAYCMLFLTPVLIIHNQNSETDIFDFALSLLATYGLSEHIYIGGSASAEPNIMNSDKELAEKAHREAFLSIGTNLNISRHQRISFYGAAGSIQKEGSIGFGTSYELYSPGSGSFFNMGGGILLDYTYFFTAEPINRFMLAIECCF